MKVSGSAVLNADRARVFAALNDPAVLMGAIPGCDALELLAEDRYRMTVTAGVASIKGSYDGEVHLGDKVEPESFTLRARGSGAPGTVDATCRVLLLENLDGTTRLDYDADAVVGGMVGGVGQRMLSGVAKKMAGQFFGNVDDVLTGRRPAAVPAVAPLPVAVGAPGAPQVLVPAAPAPRPVQVDIRNSLGAAAVGAAIALVGVLVGWRIGRRG